MSFLLGGSGSGSPLHPLQLNTQDILIFLIGCQFHIFPGSLCLQKSFKIRLIVIKFTFVNLYDPVADPIQKIPVVGHHHQCSFTPDQRLFQPQDHIAVQMVGRLIQQQNIAGCHQCCSQCHFLFLSAGQMVDHFIFIQKSHLIQHGLAVTCDTPFIILCLIGSHYIIIDGHALWKFRILWQITHIHLVAAHHFSLIWLLHSCKNP